MAAVISVFEADATPPKGHSLCIGLVPPVSRVADPLSARGVVITPEGQDPIVLCAVDWVILSNGSHDLWRRRLADAAGTSPDRVSVHTTHPHDAPGADLTSQRLLDAVGLEKFIFDPAFEERVVDGVTEAMAAAAKESFRVTHLSMGRARVYNYASTRRLTGADGRVAHVRYSSCREESVRALKEGLIDPFARVLGFWQDERPVAALSYYASHPQSFYRTGMVSGDTPALARTLRDLAVPEALHVHFCGAGGNVAAGKYNDGSPLNRLRLAGRLASGLGRAWENSVRIPLAASDIDWRTKDVAIPPAPSLADIAPLREILENPAADGLSRARAARRIAFSKFCRQGRKYTLGCLRLGPARVLHSPGELFVEYQLAAQACRPGEFVCLAAYGDGGPGYIGTRESYAQGGYECDPRFAQVSPGVDDVLSAAFRELLAD